MVGWDRDLWLVQPRATRKGRSEVTDVLLFADRTAKEQANTETQKDRRFRHGVAIVESKRWDRPLDRATKGARKGEEEREVPSSQILRYLGRAETLSDRRVQWGILINGRLWRLYHQGAKSRSEEYLEIDLSRLLDIPALSDLLSERNEGARVHWLRVFALMLGRASFAEQRAAVGPSISSRSMRVSCGRSASPRACRTSCSAGPSRASSHHWTRPIRSGPLHARRNTCVSLREQHGHYYGRLRGLFRAIDKGEPWLGLPRYNGGLFDPTAAPLLERVDLPDVAFAPLIDALSRHDRRRINYRDLGPAAGLDLRALT